MPKNETVIFIITRKVSVLSSTSTETECFFLDGAALV